MPRSSSRSYIRRGNIAVARSTTFSLGDDQKPSMPTRLRRRSASDILSALGIRELARASPSTAASPAIFRNCSRITGRYSSQWPSASTTGWFKWAWSSRAVMDETSSFGDGSAWCWWPETIEPPPERRQALPGVALLRGRPSLRVARRRHALSALSECEPASLGRALPLAAGIIVEDQSLVGIDHEPEAAVDLRLELPGRPARVSGREQHAARTGAVRQRVEHLWIARDRDAVLHQLTVAAHPLDRMQNEAASGLHGRPVVNATVASDALVVTRKRFEDARQGHGRNRTIHHEAERAGRVVPEHVDDGVGEARIAEALRGHQQLSLRAAGRRRRRRVRRT